MITLKAADSVNVEKEWEFVRDIPETENEFTNPWAGISREDFEKTVLPQMIKSSEASADGKVPETFFFLWDDETIVGQFRLRHYLTDELKKGEGHISFYIGKDYRGKGYASEGLRLTTACAKKQISEDEIYLKVSDENRAAIRVIQKNGGHTVGFEDGSLFVRIDRYTDERFRFIFVRHGEPDYQNDTLTELGKKQAAAAAERLKSEGIDEIYASPMGRAYDTASFTAGVLGKPITKLDFMHEIGWGGDGVRDSGHPWTVSSRMIDTDNFDFYTNDWKEHPDFAGNSVMKYYDLIMKEMDKFLETQGFIHEGGRYLCKREDSKTIALFSHGGSGACALSHILSLPLPYVCTVMPYEFTSIIILEFPVKPGMYVHPRIELFNETKHMQDISSGLKFQQEA